MTDVREKAFEVAALASANEQRRDVGLPPLEVLGTDMTSELVRRYTRVAIDAFEAAMWQPMESAPRDGTALLAQIGERFAVIYWSGEAWDLEVGFAMFDDADDEPPPPRRWRPIPLPPKEENKP